VLQPELPRRQSARAALCCPLCPVRLCHVFEHSLMNDKIFGKMLLNIKYMFLYSLQLLSEIFLILRRIQRDTFINTHRSSCTVPAVLVTFYGNLNFLGVSSKNIQISTFMENLSIEGRPVPRGQADGWTDKRQFPMSFRCATSAGLTLQWGSTFVTT
jgi:hypothetical protein